MSEAQIWSRAQDEAKRYFGRNRQPTKQELEKRAWDEEVEKSKRDFARDRRKDRLRDLEWQVAQLRKQVEQDDIERDTENGNRREI